MNPIKSLLRRTLLACGYDLRKVSQIGLEASTDIRRICGHPLRAVMDVGAHEGETACLFAHEFPQATIHSFEPFPASLALLKEATRNFPKVKIHPYALGDTDGTTILHVNTSSATNSILSTASAVAGTATGQLMESRDQISIEVRRLDRVARETGLDFIDLLKMDVQGFELQVLRGAEELLRQNRIAQIYSEVTFEHLYDGQASFHDLHTLLASHGFQLVDLYSPIRSDQQAIRWCDVLFVNPAALSRNHQPHLTS